ncbi:MAG: hypothetical protein R2708_28575 [Vicinamibacterales bacterium]
MLQVLAGYDRLDIASVEHPTENYVGALALPVKGLRVGVARVPFFDHLDDGVAAAFDAALGTLAALTAGTRDVVLPSTSQINLNGEMCLPRGALPADGRPLSDPHPPQPEERRGSPRRRYVRGRWALELMRRLIDDSFREVDVVVLPTRRHTPRTVEASLTREETDVPRNPELEHRPVQHLRHPRGVGAVRIHPRKGCRSG